jgi:hypothetical protein
MIAMTCSLGLGQATPDRTIEVPEPGSFVLLATGLIAMIIVARVLKPRSGDIA